MRASRLLLTAIALCGLAMGERPKEISVRFFSEANARDTSAFATPIKLGNPPRDAFLQKVPAINERQIRAIYPFRTQDGTWGCAFKLDHDGRLALEVVSTEQRGTFLVGFLGTKKGNHRMVDLLIDKPVTDGVISVPHGLTDLEIAVLSKQFKVLGNAETPTVKKESKGMWPFGKKKPAA